MKILWFSNVILSGDCKATGSWLFTMSESLLKCNQSIELINITQASTVKEILRQEVQSNLVQYVLPVYPLKNGLPDVTNIEKIVSIVTAEKPLIVHIWGTESYWGLLSARGYIKGNVLLEMQGIISTCHKAYYGGMGLGDIVKSISFKEILLPNRLLPILRRRFLRKIKFEKEIIQGNTNIAVQSNWVERYIRLIKPNANIFHSLISVRKPFLDLQWNKTIDTSCIRLVTISSAIPYKGLLDIIYALSYLKKNFPNIQLAIIGAVNFQRNWIKRSGYEQLILTKINKLKLKENVEFCGPLKAEDIVKKFSVSDIFVQSSYVESYSLAVAEAMAYGMPCVVSSAGAMAELGNEGENLSFFVPGDSFMCASKIQDLILQSDLAQTYSENAKKIGLKRNDPMNAVERQLQIYNHILG